MKKHGTGDKGETSLLGGARVWKDDERLEVSGDLDELNSLLGFARSLLEEDDEVAKILLRIQRHLFTLGSEVASLGTGIKRRWGIGKGELDYVERLVEEYEGKLPPLSLFIYPGGVPAAAVLHLARAVARRAERRLVTLSRRFEVSPLSLAYMNRLSTLLFALARYLNLREGAGEKVWRSP